MGTEFTSSTKKRIVPHFKKYEGFIQIQKQNNRTFSIISHNPHQDLNRIILHYSIKIINLQKFQIDVYILKIIQYV